MRPLEAGDPTSVGQGRYRLTGRLGQGGMGVVFFGRSLSGRAVAVKVVRPELTGEPGFRRRFADEVAAARRVGGFHTAPVVDADPDGDPAWLVTAFVPGPTLADVLARMGSLPTDTLRVLGAGLAEALEAVHRAGVIHRDLKPANIIVAEDGPRVIDFGIARALDGTTLTRTGFQIGTPGFLAPEQLTGAAVTPAVDMFAFGLVLAQAAGAAPFGAGPSAARHYRAVHEQPDLTGVPDALRPLIADCLAKSPADRPSPRDALTRLTAHPLPDGAWPPAEATALLPTVSPAPDPAPGNAPGAADGTTSGPATVPAPADPTGTSVPPAPSEGDGPKPASAPDGHGRLPRAPYSPATPPEEPAPGRTPGSTARPAPAPPAHDGPRAPYSPATPPEEPAPGRTPGSTARPAPASAADDGPYSPTAPAATAPGVFGPPPGASPVPPAAGSVPPGPVPPAGPGGGRPARRRAPLLAALLVAAAAVAGVVVWQPWASGGHATAGTRPSAHAGTSAKAPGPAALPTAPLLVRMDTAPGWPDACHAVIALRDAADDRPRRIVDGGTCDVLPVWAPDGKRFAFTRVSPDRTQAAWVANADGSGARRVAATAGGRVSWSPDGSRLAVVRRQDGVLQVFTVSVADGSAAQVTTGHQDAEDPAWSPDGSRMALCRQTEPGLWQVFVLDVTAGATTPHQVTHGTERALTPQWSPDGRRLVYAYGKPGAGSQGDIHVIGADGTGDRPLAATADQEMDPVWSHDGTWVAYVRGPIPTPAVWAVRSDGTGARPLTTGTVPEGHPSWR